MNQENLQILQRSFIQDSNSATNIIKFIKAEIDKCGFIIYKDVEIRSLCFGSKEEFFILIHKYIYLAMYAHILAFKYFQNFSSLRLKPHKTVQIPFKRWQIVKGDVVKVRSGGDKGKVGRVWKVYRKYNAIVVAGVNMRLKTFRTENDGTVQKRKPSRIHVSNVGLYDPSVDKAVRIKYGFHPETGEKLRISKKSGRVIQKPKREGLKRERRGKNRKAGEKDTTAELAHKVTYQGEDFEQIKRQFEEFIAAKEKRERNLVFNL